MRVYLARHGQSNENARDVHQTSAATLSEIGKTQSEELAQRLKDVRIDLIVASPFERARETAEIVNKTLEKPIQLSELFRERKRPSAIEGLRYDDPTAVEIRDQIKSNFHDPTYKHSDEESFEEIKIRAKEAIRFLENLKKEYVLVVTHGDFILCMLGIMIFGDEFDSKTSAKFFETFVNSNTGVSICEIWEKWRIITFNNTSKLED